MIPPKELFEFEKFKEMTTKKYGTLRGGYVRDDGHMYYTYDSGELKVGSDFMYANGDVWHGKGSNPSMKFWENGIYSSRTQILCAVLIRRV